MASPKMPTGQVFRYGVPGLEFPMFCCGDQKWVAGKNPHFAHLEKDFIDYTPPVWDREEDDPLRGLGSLSTWFKSWAELHAATLNPIQWVWHGIVANDHLVDIGGFVAGGKTTFATLLICALANPNLDKPIRLFDREIIPAPPDKKVVVIEEENGVHSMRYKLERACKLLDLPFEKTIDRMLLAVRKEVTFNIERQKNGEPQSQTWQDLEAYIRRQGAYSVFIDSRALVLTGGDANDEQDQVEVAKKLRRLVNQGKCPIWVLSHLRKPNMNNRVNLEDIAGSGQRVAAGDTVLLVEAQRDAFTNAVQATRLVFSKLRDDFEDHPNAVVYRVKDDEGNYILSYDVDNETHVSTPAADTPVVNAPDEHPHETWVQQYLAANGPTEAKVLKATLHREFRKKRKDNIPTISAKQANVVVGKMKKEGLIKFKKEKEGPEGEEGRWMVSLGGDLPERALVEQDKFQDAVEIDWSAVSPDATEEQISELQALLGEAFDQHQRDLDEQLRQESETDED
jgi:hypothetical protein